VQARTRERTHRAQPARRRALHVPAAELCLRDAVAAASMGAASDRRFSRGRYRRAVG
jgi:hypothetical protein